MISLKDVAVLDLNSARLGVGPWDLMSRAGRALFEEVSNLVGAGRVLVVCGPGNNGADGFVCAHLLHSCGRFKVAVLLVGGKGGPGTELARRAYSELDPAIGLNTSGGPDGVRSHLHLFDGNDAIIDALLGSGAKGRPTGDIAAVVEMMNRSPGKKVAVDVPTGLGTGTCVKADLTVTFHDLKEGMCGPEGYDPCCGTVVVRDIGIPVEAATLVGPGDLLRLPVKGQGSKKGETGRLLIIGGGPYAGAPTLSALAAVRAGSDLVRVAVPSGIFGVIASMSPDLIVERLPTNDPFRLGPEVLDALKALADRSHCVLIGPGSGNKEATLQLLAEMIIHASERNIPLVIDADGSTAVARHLFKMPIPGSSDVVLTPHRGELKMLLDAFLPDQNTSCLETPIENGRYGPAWTGPARRLVGRLSMASRAIVLAKGPADLIVSQGTHSLGDHISEPLDGGNVIMRTNITGVPEMSVGGTGDVLAGLCAGLIACGASGIDAACVSAYVNGRAGEDARAELGRSLSASSLLKHLRFSP